MRRSAGTAAAVAFIVLVSSSAFAQQASTTGTATALFDQGVALMDKGKFAEACPKLARSNELSPNGGTLFALAECYESNGQTASAWVTYKEAAIRATAAHRDEAANKANASASKLEPRVPRLTIDVAPGAADVPGLTIKLDARTVTRAEFGVSAPIDPGKHVIEASAPNHQPMRATTIDVANAGGTKNVLIPVLAPLPAATAVTTPGAEKENPKRGRTQRIIGIGVGAVGVAGVAVGTIFGLRASSKNDDAAAHCKDDTRCDAEGIRLDGEGRDAATISTISFIAGGALIAGGVVLFLTAPSGKESASSKPLQSVSLQASPNSLSLSGRF